MFDITTMLAKLNQYQGLAKQNYFMVSIDSFGGTALEAGDFRFFCQAINIPGKNHNTVEYKPKGFGLSWHMPSGISLDQLSATFMLDSKNEVISFFDKWSQRIVNTNDSNPNADINGQMPYEIGYKDECSATITISFYSDDTQNNVYEYTFKGCIPTNIGSVDLSFANNNSIAMLPVSFSFTSFSVTSHVTGTSQSGSNRGNGLIEFITQLGQYGQVFGATSFTSRLQSAIDKYTRVKNTWDAIQSIF